MGVSAKPPDGGKRRLKECVKTKNHVSWLLV
jgi:hypothetical protein